MMNIMSNFLCVLLISQCYGSYKQTNNVFVPLSFLYSCAHRRNPDEENIVFSHGVPPPVPLPTSKGNVSLTHNMRKAVVGRAPKDRPLTALCENTRIFCCNGL